MQKEMFGGLLKIPSIKSCNFFFTAECVWKCLFQNKGLKSCYKVNRSPVHLYWKAALTLWFSGKVVINSGLGFGLGTVDEQLSDNCLTHRTCSAYTSAYVHKTRFNKVNPNIKADFISESLLNLANFYLILFHLLKIIDLLFLKHNQFINNIKK